jgi:hypothetical protein
MYRKYFNHISKLKTYSIIATIRSGSDFLQSLCDGHPQIITFNGNFLPYYEFFSDPILFNKKNKDLNLIVDKFIYKYFHKLDSRYDFHEKKYLMGKKKNQTIKINIPTFKKHLINFLKINTINKKNFYLSVHAAYELCLGYDILKKKVIIFHPHVLAEFFLLNKDFPDTHILLTYRDPRSAFYSCVTNYLTYFKEKNNLNFFLEIFSNLLRPIENLNKYKKNNYTIIRLEDLPSQNLMIKFSKLLNIDYKESLLKPTFAKILWGEDSLSKRKYSLKWSKNRINNNYNKKMSKYDILILNAIFFRKLNIYNYDIRSNLLYSHFFRFIFIFLPTTYELKIMFIYNIKKIFFSRHDVKTRIILIFDYYFIFKRILQSVFCCFKDLINLNNYLLYKHSKKILKNS